MHSCGPGSTGMFAGVTGSAATGSFSITFDREMRTEDRSPVSIWDLEIVAHAGQELILSGAPGMQPPPTWGGGYRVMGNGSLILRSLTLGGNVTVEADGVFNVSHAVSRFGMELSGRIVVTSCLLLGSAPIELPATGFITVHNTTVYAPAAGLVDGQAALTSSSFMFWASWLSATEPASPIFGHKFAHVTILLDGDRAPQANLPIGTVLGHVTENSGQAECVLPGWEGVECLDDIDECAEMMIVTVDGQTLIVDGQPVFLQGGCEQLCVNTPGSYHCACKAPFLDPFCYGPGAGSLISEIRWFRRIRLRTHQRKPHALRGHQRVRPHVVWSRSFQEGLPSGHPVERYGYLDATLRAVVHELRRDVPVLMRRGSDDRLGWARVPRHGRVLQRGQRQPVPRHSARPLPERICRGELRVR